MKRENWLPVEGYENYEVSDFGRVRSLNYKRTGEIRIMKLVMDTSGYLRVHFHKDGKEKWLLVHRLVATAFVPNMFGDECVNHINEVKTDNRAKNLMWCSVKENNVWGSRIQRISEKLSKPVFQFTKDGKFIREWSSASEVERVLGFFQGGVSICCREECKSYKGYIWKYKTVA